jgi:hypothetical protein
MVRRAASLATYSPVLCRKRAAECLDDPQVASQKSANQCNTFVTDLIEGK